MVALAKPQPNTKSNEWYTPAKYIEAARAVMGSIDLDPASCTLANQTVKAKQYYTKEDDGLSEPWYGRVWLNPPYIPVDNCRFPQPAWSRKLQHEYKSGNVEQAIMLVSSSVKQKWFHETLGYLTCFMLERIFFDRPGKEPEELWHGNTAIYMGKNEQKFIEVFSEFGTIVRAIDTPKPVNRPRGLWEVL